MRSRVKRSGSCVVAIAGLLAVSGCGGAKPAAPQSVKAPAGTEILKAPPSACSIEADAAKDDTFSYVGNLWVDGSAVAHTSELGAVEKVKLTLLEKEPLGFIDLVTDKFVLHTYFPIAMPAYYGKAPIVRDGWLHYDVLSIQTPAAVSGADFAPHTELFDWVVPEASRFGEPDSFKVPCANATPFLRAGGGPSAELAPDGTKPQPGILSAKPPLALLDDSGKSVANLEFPAEKTAPERHVLIVQKKKNLVQVRFDAGRALRGEGWVPASAVKPDTRSTKPGFSAGPTHRKMQYTYLKCMQDAPIWVNTVEGTKAIGFLRAEHPVRGAFHADTGDFRMDLGSDEQWSPGTPKPPQKGSPVEPYVPKSAQTGICGEVAPPAGK